MWPILHYGSEEQKDRWLPLLQQGKVLGCFGLTEPDFGSNPKEQGARLLDAQSLEVGIQPLSWF